MVADQSRLESTKDRAPVVGAVLCGGASSRFGSDKCQAPAGGRLLGQRVVDAMRSAGIDPVVAVGGSAGHRLGVITIPDFKPGIGPLGALATVLRWAKHGFALVAPCDLPLLDAAHLRPLVEAAVHHGLPAVAVVDHWPQPSVACWPASLAPDVAAQLAAGQSRWRQALELGPWVPVELPSNAVRDADTPEELATLLQLETE